MRTCSLSTVLLLCLAVIPASGITTHIVVQNTNDSGPGSLRQAIHDSTIGGTISFTNTIFATPQTIFLSTTGDVSFGASALNINQPLFILGPAAPNAVTLAVAPGSSMRLLEIVPDGHLTLSNLVLKGGQAIGGAGGGADQRGGSGGGAAGLGGAILNLGTLALVNCVLATNEAVGGAGGSDSEGNGQGSGGGGGGLGGAGGPGGEPSDGGIGGPPGIAVGGTNTSAGADGGVGGGGGGGGSGPANSGSGAGGSGGFGGGGGGGGAYNTAGGSGGAGGPGGNGGFGGGGGGGGAGTPDGTSGSGGFGGGAGGVGTGGNFGATGGGGAGFGGSIFNDGGTLTATNSTFSQNSVVSGQGGDVSAGSGAAYGGAIFNRNGSVAVSGGSFVGNAGWDLFNLGDGTNQIARIILIGVTASETNSAVNGGRALPIAPVITSAVRLYNGVFVLTFTNLSGTNFTVIGSTNPGAPASNWISLGAPFQASGDFYEFIDNSASNRATFFYQLRFP